MRIQINGSAIHIMQGDITQQTTDAIVNAANSSLMGGGGVDGAIHRTGGPEIKAECMDIVKKQGKLPTGDAVITTAGKMAAKYVIHTAGPVYKNGKSDEDALLSKAYKSCLKLAVENDIKTIAFPSISTGAYGYPLNDAATIALQTVLDTLRQKTPLVMVRFVLFDDRSFAAYQQALTRLSAQI